MRLGSVKQETEVTLLEGPEIQFSEAVIDNGRFGKRVIRFETGRLAKQAAGAAMVYIDEETALLSATTAGKHPREGFDFFPLTVDVEERMYAAGRIPGSFFRREGRPSTEAILACRLMDRPLRPAFVKGLRNEVQIVVTVLSINPDELYDVVAINASSMSTQLSGLPFSGPIGGVRVALVADENGSQWVAFPKHSQLENAVFNMVVAGRIAGDDVAIMMVEAEATDNSWNLIKEQGATAPTAEVEVLPRVHGSAIFERGETQIMGVTTLNMLKMEQQIDSLSPVTRKRYMHNYNFPPYSTGETGRVGSPKRREIGHGALAERALIPVLPPRAPVAGIAMGLISDTVDGKTEYIAITDILGAEDAMGDMDFKVAGTREFVTALQLDTKLDGIPAEVLAGALTQAKDARLAILDVMNEAIDTPDEMSPFAPRIISVQIPVDQIGAVIGPKGKMINQIQDETGAQISIEDDGTIYIGADDGPKAEAARAMINAIANPHMPEVGERYLGTVVKTAAFGAFVSLLPGKDGLLHISQLRKISGGKRVENVDDVVTIGQKIQVEIKEIDDRGKLSLVPVIDEDAADK